PNPATHHCLVRASPFVYRGSRAECPAERWRHPHALELRLVERRPSFFRSLPLLACEERVKIGKVMKVHRLAPRAAKEFSLEPRIHSLKLSLTGDKSGLSLTAMGRLSMALTSHVATNHRLVSFSFRRSDPATQA